MFVGGEFYEDNVWVTSSPSPPVRGAFFLNGGRACLTVIAHYLRANSINRILLPSYLCPNILDVLDASGFTYDFYQINEDLSIDQADLQKKAQAHQAVYLINYFGFLHSPRTRDIFRDFKLNGKMIVEDNAQACTFVDPIGDFVFNSMRKFCGFDGSYMATRIDCSEIINAFPERFNRRLPVIREYRRRLADYLYKNQGSRTELDTLFHKAETLYRDGVIHGNAEEKQKIECLDWTTIKSVRRQNYEFLLRRIVDIPHIKPIFRALQPEIMPLGLPVYVDGISRDMANEELSEAGISLSIHWDDLLNDPRTNHDPLVTKMAGSMLTLVVDQYTSRSQLEYLARNLERVVSTRITKAN